MKALANSRPSTSQNCSAPAIVNSAPKISAPANGASTASSSSAGVGEKPAMASAVTYIPSPTAILPMRRSERSRLEICSSSGTGRISSVSRRPERICAESPSISPKNKSPIPKARAPSP